MLSSSICLRFLPLLLLTFFPFFLVVPIWRPPKMMWCDVHAHCPNIKTCSIQSEKSLCLHTMSVTISSFWKWMKQLFDTTTALFDEYCNKCDLEFVAWVCLKIHDNSTRTQTVINVISNYSSLNVISSYSSLNNFEEGRESKIFSAKVNRIRESKIFLYDISMVKYDLSYMTISIDIQLRTKYC